MPKRKLGKNRLDKYYHLAKGRGYRARSAFKLIQLDQKYGLLSNCSSVVDLCASPGGWLQVVAERNIERVVGIDIVPIKPITGVECIVCDITTDTCRKELNRVMGEEKADLFLHDGSPNSGVSWVQDAYAQNELVLFAMKLASEFLRAGGAFLTKVFRSRDYCALLSVCNRIFEVVEATKPLSSRSESAEIFVYCRGFLPQRVRVDYFNPSITFREEEAPKKFNTTKVLEFADFLHSVGTLRELQSFEKIRYSAVEGLEDVIDEETRLSFEDLRLLGPPAMRNLLRVRKKVLRMIEENKVTVDGVSVVPSRNPVHAEEVDQLDAGEKSAKSEQRRERKKQQKALSKLEGRPLLPDTRFFKDRMFREEMDERLSSEEAAPQEPSVEECQVSSCSDSMELDEEELLTAARLKEDEEEFIMASIDRYCNNDMSNLPDFIREEEKMFERRVPRPLQNKKELEAIGRRRKRAMRIAQKAAGREGENGNGDEDGIARKRTMRAPFRKTRSKPRIVFSTKGRFKIPKGKGRLKFVDRRMKKDKRGLKARKPRALWGAASRHACERDYKMLLCTAQRIRGGACYVYST
ncbi:UNVERIFIED_CONTAM: hypothetical protein PYX00_011338 [Menopon gallinae]|uniref:2'-O-ribose RNA methyltransferase SPB1 homolog n=1 Tax=Menopon gallinae TaxID=328185 RepID=A0AAW2H774_9NEOP